MKLELGDVFTGKVCKIAKFGAFVDIGGGKTGLVHISEISNDFVKEVKEYLEEGQTVKVKVIGLTDKGKIELSMKRLTPEYEEKEEKQRQQRKKASELRFEDMMNKFKKLSDDKLLDFNKKSEPRKTRASHRKEI